MSNIDWFNESISIKPISKVVEVHEKKINYLVWGNEGKPGLYSWL